MSVESTIRVPAEAAEDFVTALLVAAGVPANHAAITAYQLVLSDLRGVETHGIMRLPNYLERIQRGELEPSAEPTVERSTPGTATVDGQHGLGQVVSHTAMALAVEKARTVGVGTVVAHSSSHFGAAAGYTMIAAQEGCVGIAVTNAWPLLPAVDGAARLVGNNPMSIGAPTRLGYPMVLDIAMSHVAAGKLRVAVDAEQSIPPDWAFDAGGEPTTDPYAALFGGGFLRPMGDHKGFGLAMMNDVLAGVLSGAGFGAGVTGLDEPGYVNVGHCFVALDINAFMNLDTFLDRIDRLAGHVHESPTRRGADRVLIPGELEAETTLERRANHIPYPTSVWERLIVIATSAGVAVPSLA